MVGIMASILVTERGSTLAGAGGSLVAIGLDSDKSKSRRSSDSANTANAAVDKSQGAGGSIVEKQTVGLILVVKLFDRLGKLVLLK